MQIYGLTDPRNGALRYVGATRVLLQKRLTGHICDARQNKESSHKVHWIRSLLKQKLEPEIFLIEDSVEWEAEQFWINYFISIGADLTNLAGGGPGPWENPAAPGLAKFKKTVSEKLKGNQHAKGIIRSEEYCKKLSASLMGHPTSDKTRNAISESNKGRKGQTAWNKGLHNGYWSGKHLPEDHKKKISVTRKSRNIPGVWKGKHLPESMCQQISKTLTGRKLSEEHCKNVSISLVGNTYRRGKKASSETRNRQSISQKKRWAKIKETRGQG